MRYALIAAFAVLWALLFWGLTKLWVRKVNQEREEKHSPWRLDSKGNIAPPLRSYAEYCRTHGSGIPESSPDGIPEGDLAEGSEMEKSENGDLAPPNAPKGAAQVPTIPVEVLEAAILEALQKIPGGYYKLPVNSPEAVSKWVAGCLAGRLVDTNEFRSQMIEKLRLILNTPGPSPGRHRQEINRLRQHWPNLYYWCVQAAEWTPPNDPYVT